MGMCEVRSVESVDMTCSAGLDGLRCPPMRRATILVAMVQANDASFSFR